MTTPEAQATFPFPQLEPKRGGQYTNSVGLPEELQSRIPAPETLNSALLKGEGSANG